MIIEVINTLYAYNAWANGRVLDTAANLTPDQLKTGGSAGLDSIHRTLVHTMSAQWFWLSRWQGVSPTAMLDPADFADLAAIRSHWDRLEQETQDFIKGLDEAALQRVVAYRNTKGAPRAFPLWQLMLHQVNHATQHRSEVAAMLTTYGYSPDWLDIIRYLELQKETS